MAKTAANPVYRVTTDHNANTNVIVQRTNHVTVDMVVFVDLVLQGQTVIQVKCVIMVKFLYID
jgi:hypothetical protein